MSKSKSFTIKKGEVLEGSGLLKQNDKIKKDRVSHMLEHMRNNTAYLQTLNTSNSDHNSKLLNQFTESYKQYRQNWNYQPDKCIRDGIIGTEMRQKGILPLCIDIETAAVCDLACPFCFRGYFATPDKLINADFCYDLIDQAAELKVPSIKFNWRGEPLLHPKLPDFIAYAKSKGILETIINTNANTLDEKKSKDLIESGLDFIIYSFDGGTKETYEKMRPGRFKENKFEEVYENIKNFNLIRSQMRSALPYTKIQMIMTEETFDEKESFFNLFSDCVDDVSVSQYTERGGEITDIDEATRGIYNQGLLKHDLPEGTPYMRDPKGRLFLSKHRKPCEQPFQRLLVTYEGRVGMCCYDWGAAHPVGYLKPEAYQNDKEYDNIIERARKKDKGFELLSKVEKSIIFNQPPEKVNTLKEIWFGKEIDAVRKIHISNNVDDVVICSGCDFKDTYEWIPANKKGSNTFINTPEGLV